MMFIKRNNRNKAAAFTIIELIVSIVIIGILASIAVVSYPGIKKQMTISQMNADLRTAATQLSRDFAKNGKYPDTKEESGDGKGLTAATGTTLAYEYNSATNAYCIAATNGSVVYHIDAKTKTVSIGLCPAAATFAVAWASPSYDLYDSASSMIQTADGGYIVAGNMDTEYSGGYYDDALMIKYDSSGNLSWSKTWGEIDSKDYANSIIQTADNGYIIAGTTDGYGAGDYDAFSAKYDSSGNLLWSKTWGGVNYDSANSMCQTIDGGYIIAGQTDSFGSSDAFLAKYDSSGNLSWDKTWGGTESDYAESITQTIDGGYVITGDTRSYGIRDYDVFSAKYDASGNLLWSKTWGGTTSDSGQAISRTTDGGYIISGIVRDFAAGVQDAFLLKYDRSGNLTWNKTWGGASFDTANSIIQTKDGGYIMAGETDSYDIDGDSYAFLNKYDPSGSLLWSQAWSGSDYDFTQSIIQTSDGGYAMTGETWSYSTTDQYIFFSKYKTDGLINNCPSTVCRTLSAFTVTNPYVAVTSPSVNSISPDAIEKSISSVTINSPISTHTVIVAPM